MRLINTKTLEIKEHGDRPPRYAILSHTWGPEEVTFQDCVPNPHKASSKHGYAKFRGACAQARKDHYDYLWIDTNCIDKTSHVELTEAINSMFKWYSKAHRCYTYLSDVADDAVHFDKCSGMPKVTEAFRRSKWFTRGWTLQELLATRDVVFFSRNWQRLGTKLELQIPVSEITGIPTDYLVNNQELRTASVAQRMSWISKRETTQLEDMAYSMLGILGIFMPLIYGEGTRAFMRLQEALLKTTDDHSIFCWEWDNTVAPGWVSILAPCPGAFANSGKYVPKLWDGGETSTPCEISNAALSINLPLIQTADPSVVLAVLEVMVIDRESRAFRVGLPLQTGRLFQRLPCPPRPVPIIDSTLGGTKNIFINTAEHPLDHRFKASDLAQQQSQSRRFHSDLGRAAQARVAFFLAFHLDGCEVELGSAQPGVELLKSVSMVAFIDGSVGTPFSFMATTVKIKHKTFGETFVLLGVRRHGSGYLFYTEVLPPNQRHTKKSIEGALFRLRQQTEREGGDKSYQSGCEVCVTMGGSFPFSGNGGPTVKTVQVWPNRAVGKINPVQKVKTGLFGGLRRTLSRT